MYIKRIAEFKKYYLSAKDLIALINSANDTFNETITIKK